MIHHILRERKNILAQSWEDAIYATYPFDTKGFLRSQANPFANPVGQRTKTAVETMLEAVIEGTVPEGIPSEKTAPELYKGMDAIIRIRAVQDFTPGQVVGIIPLLKDIIHACLIAEGVTFSYESMRKVERSIDRLTLMAVDIHAQCRELMHEQKVGEFKRRYSQLIRRAERLTAASGDTPTANNH